MDRYIEVTLRKRGVSCIARMLDDLAPKTCEAVWECTAAGERCLSCQIREQRSLLSCPTLCTERDRA